MDGKRESIHRFYTDVVITNGGCGWNLPDLLKILINGI
jgi:hypothetical protein